MFLSCQVCILVKHFLLNSSFQLLKKIMEDWNLVSVNFVFFSYVGGAKAVPVPTKVECLAGITIRMVALGSEHSVAVTGIWEISKCQLFCLVWLILLVTYNILQPYLVFIYSSPDGGESLSWGGGSGRLGHGHESGILGIFKSTRWFFISFHCNISFYTQTISINLPFTMLELMQFPLPTICYRMILSRKNNYIEFWYNFTGEHSAILIYQF